VFVTSDIFDLERIAARRRIPGWREHLLGGIAIHGTEYPGPEALARFYVEAAKACALSEDMKFAGYAPRVAERLRALKPKSLERLARGELRGAKNAEIIMVRGDRRAIGMEDDIVSFGGESSGSPRATRTMSGPKPVPDYPYRAFDADFIFPADGWLLETGKGLLRLAVECLQPDYGYFFVRDALCYPGNYSWGAGSPLDYGRLNRDDADEVGEWRNFTREGRLWTCEWLQLRDLFQINLFSKRRLSVPTERLGYLGDWINAEPGRGRIEEIGHERVLWILTDAEMYDIRPLLNRARLLRSARPRIYRDLPIEQERPDPGTDRPLMTKQ
jgi:hypothetical protein